MRASRRVREPYAWLGVGALTLGIGAALAGAGVASADSTPSEGSASSASSARSAGNTSRGDTARPARERSAAVRTATAAANASSAAPTSAAAPASAATSTARATRTVSSRVRGGTVRNFVAPVVPASGLAYATHPAAPLNPRDYGPLLGALVRLSNEIQYVTADQKPFLSPVQLPSAPTQILVAGTLNAYTPNGAPFSVAVTGQPTNGTVTIDPSSGSYIYTPDAELAAAGGTDTFTITATDTGFHPLAAFLGQPAHTTTVTVPVTVAVAAPAGTTGTTAYYVTNTSYDTMQVAYYDNNGAQLSPAVGTTLATGESTEFQISEGNSVTVHFNPANVSHEGVVQSYTSQNPQGVAVSPDGATLYSSGQNPNSGEGYVTIRDVENNYVEATVYMGHEIAGLGVTPDGTRVYALGFNSGLVSVINANLKTVVSQFSVGNAPTDIAFSPDGKKGYVTDSYNVNVIDTDPDSATYNTVVAQIRVPGFGGDSSIGLAVSPDGKKAYVSGANAVSVIDLVTNTVSATIPVAGANLGLAVSPDGTKVYVANENTGLNVISAATNTVITTISGLDTPVNVIVSPGGGHVYVASQRWNGTVSFYPNYNIPSSNSFLYDIDTITNVVNTPIDIGFLPKDSYPGSSPGGLAVAPDGKSIYVTLPSNNLTSKVSVVTDGSVSDNGVSQYTVTMSEGTASCSAAGSDQCAVGGTVSYLEDAPGTSFIVPAEQAQQQSNTLQNLVYDDTSNAVFTTKSSPTIGYTNPIVPNGAPIYPNNTQSTSTETYTMSSTSSQTTSTTYNVSVKASADYKMGLLTAKAETSAQTTWGVSTTTTSTYTTSLTATAKPGETLYFYGETAVQRFYGNWKVTYGNTTYYLNDVWFDTPYTNGRYYVSPYTCTTGSVQCAQVDAGDLSSYPSSFPAGATYAVAESNTGSSYNASSSSVYTS